jgi:hypothetical protein
VVPAVAVDPRLTLEPLLQIDVFEPATAAGNGLTVITTLFVLEQPVAVIVSVRVYVVVTVGATVGFATLDTKPLGEDVQLYVRPAVEAAPSCVDAPAHIAVLVPALAAGKGFTVTTIELDLKQPVAVTVSVSV